MEFSAFAVLHHLAEIVLQKRRQFINFFTEFIGERGLFQHFIEFVGELDGKCREIIDKIERVLDLVRDAGGELPQRRHLLRPSDTPASSRSGRICRRLTR